MDEWRLCRVKGEELLQVGYTTPALAPSRTKTDQDGGRAWSTVAKGLDEIRTAQEVTHTGTTGLRFGAEKGNYAHGLHHLHISRAPTAPTCNDAPG